MGKGIRETTKSGLDGSNAALDAAPSPAPTADLALVAAQVAEEFPLVLEQTSLVLLDVDPEHLHAFWTLALGDLARAQAAFPPGGGTPERVIRLRRLHANGAAEDLATLPLEGESHGDVRFAIAPDDASYQAELGLRNPQGGWVLLARSNQARLPRPVGVPIPAWTGQESEPQTELEEPISVLEQAPAAPGAPPLFAGTQSTAMPRPSEPMPEPAAHGQPPMPGTLPARWVLDTALAGGLSEANPDVVATDPAGPEPTGSGPGTDIPADSASGETPPPNQAWQPAIPLDWRWADRAVAFSEGAGSAAWDNRAPPEAAPGAVPMPQPTPVHAGPDITNRPEPPGPISSFALGRGPEAPVLEAELLVHVSARPGTLVDLYGRPLRIGPSGRSSLRVPVTDLTLLERLLGWAADSEGS